MSNQDVKKIRKVARCIQTLLELEGHKLTAKAIMSLIEDEDLSNVEALKDKVEGNIHMIQADGTFVLSVRKQKIEKFISLNWNSIRNDNVIKQVLFNGFCMGRYNKEQRDRMVSDLVARCEENIDDRDDVEEALLGDSSIHHDVNF